MLRKDSFRRGRFRLVVHFLERFQPLLGLGLGVAVVDEEHGHEAQCDEQRGIREQDAVVILRMSVPAAMGVTTCAAMEAV